MPMTPFNNGVSAAAGNSLTSTLMSPPSSATGSISSFPFNSGTVASPSTLSVDDKLTIPTFYILDPIPPPSPAKTNADMGISEALVELYNKILVFVQKEMSVILEVTERRTAMLQASRERMGAGSHPLGLEIANGGSESPMMRSGILPPQSSQQQQQQQQPKQSYDILSSILFSTLFHRLFSELSHFIFTSGRPDSFHRNFTATRTFVDRLESLCPNLRYLELLRGSETYRELERRWSTPLMVYFQLRWKEVVQGLEGTLAVGSRKSSYRQTRPAYDYP